ncbi:MAG: NnrU family protein [Deltaproteobacteria bacterium]|jgi:uncharacterized membrane protein|nr:NnrU family protein [Deltaproteobacteria bacterium]MBW2496159.1 NnrU family protein [Deltaproteobacteria bacterium]
MGSLLLAACFFVGIHLFVAGTGLRDRLVARLGERAYLGLFSLASGVGIVWLSGAYVAASAETRFLWQFPPSARSWATIAMGFAFLFVVIGLTTPSPTAAGGEARLASGAAASGILRVTRHPFLMGVALWAGVHLVANGDTASLLFFSALLVLALAGPVSIDRKRARKHGREWQEFIRATSIVPFGAIAGGRNRLVLAEIGLWRPALAIVIWALVLVFHGAVFGVNVL